MTSLSRAVDAWFVSRTLFLLQCYDLAQGVGLCHHRSDRRCRCCDSSPNRGLEGRVASKFSLPGEWPVMLVEIFHTEDGQISMTCALGVPKSSLTTLLVQGVYLYEFHELPAMIVGIWVRISRRSRGTWRQCWIHLRQRSSRNSSWLKDESWPPLRWAQV